jgi:hypothetical protein
MANKFSISQSPENGTIYTRAGNSLTIIITVKMGMDTLNLKTEY